MGQAMLQAVGEAETRRHTLSLLVENEFGVLVRVAGLFSGRGYNIESLAVAQTIDPEISRITIVTSGTERSIEQITKQIRKLINVIRVTDLTDTPYVDRELALIKVDASTPARREEVLRVVEIFRAKIVDAAPSVYVVEVTGDEGKIAGCVELLKPLGIKEIVRTGKIAIARGERIEVA